MQMQSGATVFPLYFDKEEDKQIAFEQYKLAVESVNKLNETRENSHHFWTGINTLAVTAVAYLRDNQNLTAQHKTFLLWTLIVIGMYLCLTWLSYLANIKKSLETRHQLLVAFEMNLPVPIFTKIFSLSQEKANKSPLTMREMAVPYLFLIGYLFFAVLLLFFTSEVVPEVN